MNAEQEQIVREAEEREEIVKQLNPPQVLIPTDMFRGLVGLVREQEQTIQDQDDEISSLTASLEDGD